MQAIGAGYAIFTDQNLAHLSQDGWLGQIW